VTVTAADNFATTAPASIQLVVATPVQTAFNPAGDVDGDNFSNSWEQAFNSNPLSKGSTPFNLPAPPLTGGKINAARLSIDLDFSTTGKDVIKIAGSLPVKDTSFGLSGQIVILDVGGVIRAFTLDADGNGASGTDSIKVRLGAGGAGFSAKLTGTFAADLADERLTANASDKGRRLVRATLLLNNLYYETIVTHGYNPRTGRF
jgi:hypothetical protein